MPNKDSGKKYRLIKTDKTESYKRNGQDIQKPVFKKVYLSDEEVEKICLETGFDVPFYSQKTAIDDYFLDFWTPVLGMGPAFTYIWYVHLMYSGCDEEYSIRKTSQLMGISANTLRSYLDILEKYGFIFRLYNDTDENTTEATIKVRKSTPMLSENILDTLPPMIKEKHEGHSKYLAFLMELGIKS